MVTVEAGASTNFQGHSMFSLMFNDEVKVKKTSVDKFSFMDSLNFVGSNLGLWPGLGLYQILEWTAAVIMANKVLSKLRTLLCCPLSS